MKITCVSSSSSCVVNMLRSGLPTYWRLRSCNAILCTGQLLGVTSITYTVNDFSAMETKTDRHLLAYCSSIQIAARFDKNKIWQYNTKEGVPMPLVQVIWSYSWRKLHQHFPEFAEDKWMAFRCSWADYCSFCNFFISDSTFTGNFSMAFSLATASSILLLSRHLSLGVANKTSFKSSSRCSEYRCSKAYKESCYFS